MLVTRSLLIYALLFLLGFSVFFNVYLLLWTGVADCSFLSQVMGVKERNMLVRYLSLPCRKSRDTAGESQEVFRIGIKKGTKNQAAGKRWRKQKKVEEQATMNIKNDVKKHAQQGAGKKQYYKDIKVSKVKQDTPMKQSKPKVEKEKLDEEQVPSVLFPYFHREILKKERHCTAAEDGLQPCSNKRPLLLTYTYSSPKRFERRMYIRDTWGNMTSHGDMQIRAIFVIGRYGLKRSEKEKLESEASEFGDILLGDFKDFYDNLTLKGLYTLNWIAKCCQAAKFTVKIDDDVFFNVFNLINYLTHNATNALQVAGRVWPKGAPKRTGHAQVVSELEYPMDFYPPFVGGPAYILSARFIPKLLQVSLTTAYYRLEDVYITGMLREKAGGNITPLNEQFLEKKDKKEMDLFFSRGNNREHFFCHCGPLRFHYLTVWKRLLTNK